MEKINFVNNQPPYISADNLNQMQSNVENVINGVVLYENSNGSNENITLNDDIGNYKNVEILFKDDQGIHNTSNFIVKNGAWYSLQSFQYKQTEGQIINRGKNVQLYGNSILNGQYAALVHTASGNEIYWNNNIYIIKVIGYK